MIVSLEEIQKYAKTDEDIMDIAMAAEGYLTDAGITLDPSKELDKLAVKILTVHWNENKEPIGKADLLPFGLRAIITQLQNRPAETESGDSA